MSYTHILVYYGEIALKGRNRDFFERQLIKNIKTSSASSSFLRVDRISGRVLVTLADGYDKGVVSAALSQVYGIVYFMFVVRVKPDLDIMRDTAIELASHVAFDSFAVRARRQDKLFKHTSNEMQRYVGGAIDAAYPQAHVDLDNPDVTFSIAVVEKYAFVGCERVEGAGGLPVGVSGRVLVLLSGGIDSPVAASLMQKRGCPVDFIHFHNAPYTSEASIEKARELAKIISQQQKGGRLLLVPFTEVQKAIVKACDQRYRVLLYRRFMFRVAQAIAQRDGIVLLATGDSLAQVASQTVENIASVDEAIDMTLLRPLVGMDKQEVVAIARRIGTYEESVLPHEDCCSYFMPHDPATKSAPVQLQEQEQRLDIDVLVSDVLDNIDVVIL